MIKVPNGFDEIIETFGDIRQYITPAGTISSKWEKEILTFINLPFNLKYLDCTITHICCHKLISDILSNVFKSLLDKNLNQFVTTYGGCYSFRLKRTSHHLSTHSWAISIDIDPDTNQLGTEGNMNHDVIQVFKDFGFIWGGDFVGTKDPMHFQYCTGY